MTLTLEYQRGKPYTLIFTNDSIPSLKAFVYHPTTRDIL